MKQKQLILSYLARHGSILPAKIAGEVYEGEMFGSETSKRCRELRKAGILRSEPDGKFERFYLLTTKSEEVVNRQPEKKKEELVGLPLSYSKPVYHGKWTN